MLDDLVVRECCRPTIGIEDRGVEIVMILPQDGNETPIMRLQFALRELSAGA
jgi:hypothetical protein